MNTHELLDTAKALVADDKGVLAMDESNSTCNTRFAKPGIPRPWRPGEQALNYRARFNRAAHRGEYSAAMKREMGTTMSYFSTRKSGGIAHPEGY
jgi:fructose-bisphosphate aldolase class 1